MAEAAEAACADVIAAFTRALFGAFMGAAAGLVAALVMYQFNAPIVMEMDRDLPAMVTGLYDPERVGDDTYAWSQQDVQLALPGLDRGRPWSCTIALRGGRADVSLLPAVVLSVDGVIRGQHDVSNDPQHVTVTLPAQSINGAMVGMHVTRTFQPLSEDTRTLGVIVDRWTCAPDAGGITPPPRRVTQFAIVAGAAFGAAWGLLGATWPWLVAGGVLLGIGQAAAITDGPGAFSQVLDQGTWIGVTIAALLALAGLLWRVRGQSWSGAARFTIAWTGGVVFLKLLGLLHPLKGLVDALFHAHRVGWVMDGRYLFTQPMPSGVEFPYAIGLYVFAAPWTALTSDVVTLLRIIAVAGEATGGLLLFALVAHWWRDRQVGVAAVVLFSVVPLPMVIIGNANMTNVFAQSLALAATAAAVGWRLQPRDVLTLTGFTAITAAALLSHISTLTLLAATLGLLVVAYWWRGDREIRRSGSVIAASSAVAGLIAVLVYYRHFMDAFRSALTVSAPSQAASGEMVGLAARMSEAGDLLIAGLGAPLLVLAAVGLLEFRRRPWRDRLDLAVLAWLGTAVICIALVVVTPVEKPFLRYAAEFISRVIFTTAPAVVLLAALGVVAWWRASGLRRAAAVCGVAFALWAGIAQWLSWWH